MKYFPLIWAALRRKPVRAIVTLLSVTVAFSLFGLLIGFSATMDSIEQQSRADRVYSGARFGGQIPITVAPRIAGLHGVEAVTVLCFINGYVQDPKNHTIVFMVDSQAPRVLDDWKITQHQWNEVQQDRTGVVMSRMQAMLWHKKVGDTFTMISPRTSRADGTHTWTFKVLDIGADIAQAPAGYIFGNYDYYDKARPLSDQGQVNEIDFLTDDPAQGPAVAQQIDKIFASSATPTQSQTEKMAYAISNNFGGLDVNALTQDIAVAGLGMILFLTANVIAQSVRERFTEFATLKTIGFSDRLVIGLVVLEAATLCLVGAASGVTLAAWLASKFSSILPPGVGLPAPTISAIVLLWAAFSATAMAFASAALPALRLMRMDIATALARRV